MPGVILITVMKLPLSHCVFCSGFSSAWAVMYKSQTVQYTTIKKGAIQNLKQMSDVPTMHFLKKIFQMLVYLLKTPNFHIPTDS